MNKYFPIFIFYFLAVLMISCSPNLEDKLTVDLRKAILATELSVNEAARQRFIALMNELDINDNPVVIKIKLKE